MPSMLMLIVVSVGLVKVASLQFCEGRGSTENSDGERAEMAHNRQHQTHTCGGRARWCLHTERPATYLHLRQEAPKVASGVRRLIARYQLCSILWVAL